jgi:hypothetical protein
MNLLERLRRFWGPTPDPDHPLTAEERRDDQSTTVYEEGARIADEFVGPDLDPDEPRSGRTD